MILLNYKKRQVNVTCLFNLYMKLAKRSKQIIDARNAWTRSIFCADE